MLQFSGGATTKYHLWSLMDRRSTFTLHQDSKMWSSTSFFPVFGNWEGTYFNKKGELQAPACSFMGVSYKQRYLLINDMEFQNNTTELATLFVWCCNKKNLENQPISQTWFRGPVQRLFSRDAQQIACGSKYLWP